MSKPAVHDGGAGAQFSSSADRAIIRQWLSSATAASPWVGLIFAINIVATGYALPDVVIDGYSAHLFDLAAGLAALTVFVLARAVSHRRASQGLGANVTLWLVAGEVAVFTPIVISTLLAGQPNEALIAMLFTGVIAYPILVSLFALIYSGLRSSRSTSIELARSRQSLIAMRNALDAEISSEKLALVDQVTTQLNAGFASLPEGAQSNSVALRSLVDDVVRPLSWELETTPAHSPITPAEARRSVFLGGRQGVRYRVALDRLISPILIGGTLVVFALPATFYLFGLSGLGFGSFTVLAVVLAAAAIKQLGGHLQVSRIVGILSMTFVAAVTSPLFPLLVGLSGQPWEPALSIPLVTVLITFFSGLFLGFVALRADSFAEARRVNDEMNELVTRLRQEVWVTRKQLARVVHGQVQSKLVAASIRMARSLESTAGSEREQAEHDVRDAVALIANLGESLEASSDRSFELEMNELAAVWEGVCEVRVAIDAAASSRLRDDAVATSCLTEVAREAVANAVKHSGALYVEVNVTMPSSTRARLVMRNPGSLPTAKAEGMGYGTRILDDVTVEWGIAQTDDLVVLTADVALAAR
jgi:signal transduction histidine kinase